ncbi:MAG: hypothetical protein JST00_29660 [Deltaproteobacteria bacterium]|nr:hypothetical protein [Deltaproteobacteria bacterium]
MRALGIGSVVTALTLVLVGVGCGSSADDTSSDAKDPKWSDTTSTLGVTSWAMVPSESDGESATLTGYDDSREVRSQFTVERGKDAAGNVTVRIRSVIQGPAVLEYRGLPDNKIAVLQNTFPEHPEAKRALELASSHLGTPAASGPLVTQSVRTLDNSGPLVGNQQQLICKDSRGNACEKPPELGGATGVAASCVAGVVGLAGTSCLLSGVETIGVGCVVSALGAAYGAYQCYDGVSQRANCTCVTPCAARCQQTYNRQYMCAPNSRACADAVAQDRRDEAACVRGCGNR